MTGPKAPHQSTLSFERRGWRNNHLAFLLQMMLPNGPSKVLKDRFSTTIRRNHLGENCILKVIQVTPLFQCNSLDSLSDGLVLSLCLGLTIFIAHFTHLVRMGFKILNHYLRPENAWCGV